MAIKLGISARYQADNARAATIILRDVERYGGAGSLMVRWARLIQERAAEERRAAA